MGALMDLFRVLFEPTAVFERVRERPRWLVPAGLTAFVFLGLHAGIHLWESLLGHTEAAAHAGFVDAAGVYGPPLLALLVIVFPHARRSEEA